MKYAAEVIDLMAAYPGRQFKMIELVRHVTRARALAERERAAVRKAVSRVLAELESAGSVEVEKSEVRGAYASYCWGKVRHPPVANHDSNWDNSCGAMRL